ncbi:ATP-binding protein [Litorihabitans aurantiacus]|uniref:histidine kinase n=1 Tax=Litorihabitans aurantiacus TaxID=1930061 RepID=A0AA37XD98_9MICO|nr:hypothetical protein GCM10025875_06650 [Litorihabitans aurantiacus]
MRASTRGRDVVIDVVDDGPGIPAAERARIFDRFEQGTNRTTTGGQTGGGTGLGLAIARWAAGLHGGTLDAVAPTPPSTGATLRLVLPVDGPPPARSDGAA